MTHDCVVETTYGLPLGMKPQDKGSRDISGLRFVRPKRQRAEVSCQCGMEASPKSVRNRTAGRIDKQSVDLNPSPCSYPLGKVRVLDLFSTQARCTMIFLLLWTFTLADSKPYLG